VQALASAAGVIAVITLAARIVGFGRWFAFSHSVGATCVGSVYQSVNAVPNVLFEIAAGGVLAAVAVPLVAGALARGDRGRADAVASALLTWALLVLVPLGLIVAVAARPIAGALLGTGCQDEVDLGAELLLVFSIQIPLYGVGIVLAGVLQAHHRFVAAALAPLLSSLVVIATYLLYRGMVARPAAEIAEIPQAAVAVLAVGTTLGVVALSVPLLVPARRAGVRLRPTLTFPAGTGRRVRTLALAGLLAVTGQQLATLVVIRLANDRGGAGTLNVFSYAQAVTLLPYAVLAVPIATAAFPSLAGAPRSEDADVPRSDTTIASRSDDPVASGPDGAAVTLGRAWLATLIVTLFGAGGLVAVSGPVAAFFVALDAGAASEASIPTLSAMDDAVSLFAPSVVALGVIGLLTRASYVRGGALLAGSLAATGWLATAAVPLLVLDPAGAGGPTTLRALSAGSSLGLALGAVLLTVLVGRTWGWHALSVPARPVAAAAVAATVAAIAGRAAASWLSTRGAGHSLGGSLAAVLVFGLGALALMAVVAIAVDPSLTRRLRSLRPTRGGAR
jgi:putative peptidoglycan lipid II flippase